MLKISVEYHYLSLPQQWQCTPPAMWRSDVMPCIYCRPVNTVRGLFHPAVHAITNLACSRGACSACIACAIQQATVVAVHASHYSHVQRSALSSQCSLIMLAYTTCRPTVFLPSIQVIQRCGYSRYHYRVPLGTVHFSGFSMVCKAVVMVCYHHRLVAVEVPFY